MSAAAFITGAALFAIGTAAGIVAIVSVGIQREERYFRRTGLVSLTRLAPDRASQRTRAVVGLSVRQCAGPEHPGTDSIRGDSMRELTAATAVLADGQS